MRIAAGIVSFLLAVLLAAFLLTLRRRPLVYSTMPIFALNLLLLLAFLGGIMALIRVCTSRH